MLIAKKEDILIVADGQRSGLVFLNNNKYGSAIPQLDKKIFLDLEIPLIPMQNQLKFRQQ